MKVCPLIRISSPVPEICPNVSLIDDVLYTERAFEYCHSPTEHKVILLGSFVQVLQGFRVGLECESLASQIQPDTP